MKNLIQLIRLAFLVVLLLSSSIVANDDDEEEEASEVDDVSAAAAGGEGECVAGECANPDAVTDDGAQEDEPLQMESNVNEPEQQESEPEERQEEEEEEEETKESLSEEEETPEGGNNDDPEKSSAVDPTCPDREHIMRCASVYLDSNKNGKLDRSELQDAINGLPWYARGILSILGSLDKMMKKCDVDKDDAISIDYDMEHNKETCLANCFKRRAFKAAFFPDCDL